MKIIDLLNKIANGEEVPKKIKYYDIIYEYKDDFEDYYTIKNKRYLSHRIGNDRRNLSIILNDEIEIIEEPKKIEKFDKDKMIIDDRDGYSIEWEYLEKTLNELIDEINELKRKGIE